LSLLGIILIAALGFLILIAIVVFAFGLGATVLYWLTGIFHAVKPEDAPSASDADWDRDQGKDVK